MKKHDEYREDNVRPKDGFKFYPYTLYAEPGENVPLHWHEEFEIMLTKADGFLMLDGQTIEYKNNDILFFNSRQLHSTYHKTNGWAYHILIHPDLLNAGCILEEKGKEFHFPTIIKADDMVSRQIVEDFLQISFPISDMDKMRVMKKLFDLIYHLMSEGYQMIDDEQDTSIQTSYIKSAIKYINHNLTNKIHVQAVADHIGISKEYLMRLFKQYTGETINSYIQIHRLEAARKDLIAGYSLTDIVDKYDYSDSSYFCRLFKKHYGVSPGKIKGSVK